MINITKEHFNGLTSLTNLKLKTAIYPAIKLVEYGFIFDQLLALRSLSISDDILLRLPVGAFRNQTNLEHIEVFCERYEYEEKVWGNKQFINLPNKLFANFTSLRELSIIPNGSLEMREDIFEQNFRMLQKLKISRYDDNTLPENIFKKTPNVIELRILHNNLKKLPPNIFENFKKLEILDLSHNKLKELSM